MTRQFIGSDAELAATEPAVAVRLSPIQRAVQLVTELVQLGTSHYAEATAELHKLMRDWSYDQLVRERPGLEPGAQVPPLDVLLGDEWENDPCTVAYWANTSAFFRKVYQASAAAA